MNQADVRSDQTGEWVVVKPDGERLSVHHRQRDAELAARRLVRSQGGGKIVVHARTGRLKDVQTVPGNGGAGVPGNAGSDRASKQRKHRGGILRRLMGS